MNSSARRQEERKALSKASLELAEEIWSEKWVHVTDLRTKPVCDCKEIMEELEKRCPGHTDDEYREAISRGMWESR
jgi:hypothetical protein